MWYKLRWYILKFLRWMFRVKVGYALPKYLYPMTFILFPILTLFMIEARPLKYDLLSDTIEIKGYRISIHFLTMLTTKSYILHTVPEHETKNIICRDLSKIMQYIPEDFDEVHTKMH